MVFERDETMKAGVCGKWRGTEKHPMMVTIRIREKNQFQFG